MDRSSFQVRIWLIVLLVVLAASSFVAGIGVRHSAATEPLLSLVGRVAQILRIWAHAPGSDPIPNSCFGFDAVMLTAFPRNGEQVHLMPQRTRPAARRRGPAPAVRPLEKLLPGFTGNYHLPARPIGAKP